MPSQPTTDTLPPATVNRVLEALRGVRFGQVVVTLHEGRVVQIERTEKLRLTPPGKAC